MFLRTRTFSYITKTTAILSFLVLLGSVSSSFSSSMLDNHRREEGGDGSHLMMTSICDAVDDELGGCLELHHHRSEGGLHFKSTCDAFADELCSLEPGFSIPEQDIDHEFSEPKRGITLTTPTSHEEIHYSDDVDNKSPSVDDGSSSNTLSPNNGSKCHPPEVQPNMTTRSSSGVKVEGGDNGKTSSNMTMGTTPYSFDSPLLFQPTEAYCCTLDVTCHFHPCNAIDELGLEPDFFLHRDDQVEFLKRSLEIPPQQQHYRQQQRAASCDRGKSNVKIDKGCGSCSREERLRIDVVLQIGESIDCRRPLPLSSSSTTTKRASLQKLDMGNKKEDDGDKKGGSDSELFNLRIRFLWRYLPKDTKKDLITRFICILLAGLFMLKCFFEMVLPKRMSTIYTWLIYLLVAIALLWETWMDCACCT